MPRSVAAQPPINVYSFSLRGSSLLRAGAVRAQSSRLPERSGRRCSSLGRACLRSIVFGSLAVVLRVRVAVRALGFVFDGARDLGDATVAVREQVARDLDTPTREVLERRHADPLLEVEREAGAGS